MNTPTDTIADLRQYIARYRQKTDTNARYLRLLTDTLALMERQATTIRLLETTMTALFGSEWRRQYTQIDIDFLTPDDLRSLYFIINGDDNPDDNDPLAIPKLLNDSYRRLKNITRYRHNERDTASFLAALPPDIISQAATFWNELYYILIDPSNTGEIYLNNRIKDIQL